MGGTESCPSTATTGDCNVVPVDTLYVDFESIEVRRAKGGDTVKWDLVRDTGTKPSPNDLVDAFDFKLGPPSLGPSTTERATSFAGPTQTPDGELAHASVAPIEAIQNDSGLDRRLARFVSFLNDTTIPAGHVTVYANKTAGGVLRAYDMTDLNFASIRYSGISEELSFSVSSMSWAAGADEAEVEPDPELTAP